MTQTSHRKNTPLTIFAILVTSAMLSACQTVPVGPGPKSTGGYFVDYGKCARFMSKDVKTYVEVPSQYGGLPFHRGIDIEYRMGLAIRAAAPGTVTSVVRVAGDKRGLIISHGWFSTYYNHPIEFVVEEGDKVERNQVIAVHTRGDAPERLHFEMLRTDIPYTQLRSHLNPHKYWYRPPGDTDPWRVTIPQYDPDIEYGSDDLTFPVNCVIPDPTVGKACLSDKNCDSGEQCALYNWKYGVCLRPDHPLW